MDSMGRLPARTLPHAARISRGLRLGFGTVMLMPDFDAVTHPLAATMLQVCALRRWALTRQVSPLPRISSPRPLSLWQNRSAPNAPPRQLSLSRDRDLAFDP